MQKSNGSHIGNRISWRWIELYPGPHGALASKILFFFDFWVIVQDAATEEQQGKEETKVTIYRKKSI